MSQSLDVDACGTLVPNSPMQLTSANFGSFHGSGADFDGEGSVSEINWRKLSFVQRQQGVLLSVCVDGIKLTRKKKNLDPTCKKERRITRNWGRLRWYHLNLGGIHRDFKPNDTKNCVEVHCGLANNTIKLEAGLRTIQMTSCRTWNVRHLLEMLELISIGGPDILWLVHKLTRQSQTGQEPSANAWLVSFRESPTRVSMGHTALPYR